LENPAERYVSFSVSSPYVLILQHEVSIYAERYSSFCAFSRLQEHEEQIKTDEDILLAIHGILMCRIIITALHGGEIALKDTHCSACSHDSKSMKNGLKLMKI
jgi:hypothetical protein